MHSFMVQQPFQQAIVNCGEGNRKMGTLKEKKLFLLDMDGTIYLDNDLFDGTMDFLEYVKKIGVRYIFLTNNSSKSVDKYIEKLGKLGIATTADDFLTSTDATEAGPRSWGESRCVQEQVGGPPVRGHWASERQQGWSAVTPVLQKTFSMSSPTP